MHDRVEMETLEMKEDKPYGILISIEEERLVLLSGKLS